MSEETLNLIVGAVGAFLILVAFVFNQLGKWSAESKIYDVVNLIGGIFLIIYAVRLESIPFFLINVVWALFSLRDVIYKTKK